MIKARNDLAEKWQIQGVITKNCFSPVALLFCMKNFDDGIGSMSQNKLLTSL